MFVKICGLTTEQGMKAAVAAGTDAIGLVFARSPRQVDARRAEALLQWVPDGVARVAVFRTPSDAQIQTALALGFDAVQTDASWTPVGLSDRCVWLPALRDGPDLVARVGEFLSRAAVPGLGGAVLTDGASGGGMGEVSQWDRVADAARRHRLVLAGGLTPGNVGQAIARVRPWGVDVSSGVERAPGLKDPAKVRAFMAAVRATEVG